MNKYWYKLKYIGKSFGVDELTNGKIYCAIEDGDDMYRVVDDSGEDYLYDKINPKPTDGSTKGGKWEIIEKIESKEPSSKLQYISEYDKNLIKNNNANEIKKYIYDSNVENKEKILEFLYSGKIILMNDIEREDVIDKELGSIGVEIWRTDRKYKWSSNLIYYFNYYNLKLNNEFIEYVVNKKN